MGGGAEKVPSGSHDPIRQPRPLALSSAPDGCRSRPVGCIHARGRPEIPRDGYRLEEKGARVVAVRGGGRRRFLADRPPLLGSSNRARRLSPGPKVVERSPPSIAPNVA